MSEPSVAIPITSVGKQATLPDGQLRSGITARMFSGVVDDRGFGKPRSKYTRAPSRFSAMICCGVHGTDKVR